MSDRYEGRLEGKVAIITGAASGIGRATAARFSAEGARLILNDVSQDRLRETTDELADDGHGWVAGDVSQEDTARQLATAARDRFGRVDVLVNNAGIYFKQDVTETTSADIEHVLGINLYSMIWCCKHIIPTMLEQRSGSIVNVGSISAFTGQENDGQSQYLYNVSKAGVVQLSISLATRYAAEGIRVNSICPGLVRTNLLDATLPGAPGGGQDELFATIAAQTTPIGRVTDPAEIAAAILFLASDDSSIVLGTSLIADGGFLAR